MRIDYTHIAGKNLDRLAALSDGIFAVGMTLLVLDLHVPVTAQGTPPIQTDQDLLRALSNIAPSVLTYLLSFMTLGIFWLGQQTQLNYFVRSDRNLAWLHLGFLLLVCLMPFSTALLASYISLRLALIIYWFNIFMLGAVLLISWHYAKRSGLFKDEVTDAISGATERRILNYQMLYLCGMLLCVFSTYLSIGFIIIVQLNAVIAGRTRLQRQP